MTTTRTMALSAAGLVALAALTACSASEAGTDAQESTGCPVTPLSDGDGRTSGASLVQEWTDAPALTDPAALDADEWEARDCGVRAAYVLQQPSPASAPMWWRVDYPINPKDAETWVAKAETLCVEGGPVEVQWQGFAYREDGSVRDAGGDSLDTVAKRYAIVPCPPMKEIEASQRGALPWQAEG